MNGNPAADLSFLLTRTIANVYWELGGDVTEVGDPRAIQSLVIKQIKVNELGQYIGNPYSKDYLGPPRRSDHLGRLSSVHPCLHPLPLHPHLPHQKFSTCMLRRSWRQCGFLCNGRSRCVPAMSPDSIQLGPYYPWWDLRRSKSAGSLHWHLQLVLGCGSGCIADASALGSADEDKQEACFKRHVWDGHNVWTSPSSPPPQLSL